MARKGNEPPQDNGGGRGTASPNAVGRQRKVYTTPSMEIGGATERGYSYNLAKAVLAREAQIRKNKNESLHVFDGNGKEIVKFQGKGAGVDATKDDFAKIPQNSILTHNHPRSIGKKGIEGIGNSFSFDDIRTAIQTNAREMRAVTPTYTFSLKRPAGGWPKDLKEFFKEYKKTYNDVQFKNLSYIYSYGLPDSEADTRRRRAGITHYHKIWKEMSKKYNWDYTKKKG